MIEPPTSKIQLTTAWRLPRRKINVVQQTSIEELVRVCKQAHFVNVRVRINGEWAEFEADWIKHLKPDPEGDHAEPERAPDEIERLRAALEKIARDERAAHQAWVSRSEETARNALGCTGVETLAGPWCGNEQGGRTCRLLPGHEGAHSCWSLGALVTW